MALLIKKIINYNGKIIFDKNYPDGTMKKNLDSRIIKSLGWAPKIKIDDGLKKYVILLKIIIVSNLVRLDLFIVLLLSFIFFILKKI